jgi:hypothetical protein
MFERHHALHATLVGDDGETIDQTTDFFTTERRVPWPQANLTLHRDGDELVLDTDAFARRVRLSTVGAADHEADAWWSDNYLDLVPGHPRRVRFHANPDRPDTPVRLRAQPRFGTPAELELTPAGLAAAIA